MKNTQIQNYVIKLINICQKEKINLYLSPYSYSIIQSSKFIGEHNLYFSLYWKDFLYLKNKYSNLFISKITKNDFKHLAYYKDGKFTFIFHLIIDSTYQQIWKFKKTLLWETLPFLTKSKTFNDVICSLNKKHNEIYLILNNKFENSYLFTNLNTNNLKQFEFDNFKISYFNEYLSNYFTVKHIKKHIKKY
ncbi:hypothetical protein [Mycoplasma sp. 1018B]|uniref:hypothetical protein n=1 Tax=Mycoplasma sp. 1018B TaxID=2967302 RepID=UPI00211B7F8A|nr:hypothetical protein [Mycoplasma sp. 1018B]UUM19238.1 hypothetical protein NPA14_02830 [Mycoplasma sp. 1018B]